MAASHPNSNIISLLVPPQELVNSETGKLPLEWINFSVEFLQWCFVKCEANWDALDVTLGHLMNLHRRIYRRLRRLSLYHSRQPWVEKLQTTTRHVWERYRGIPKNFSETQKWQSLYDFCKQRDELEMEIFKWMDEISPTVEQAQVVVDDEKSEKEKKDEEEEVEEKEKPRSGDTVPEDRPLYINDDEKKDRLQTIHEEDAVDEKEKAALHQLYTDMKLKWEPFSVGGESWTRISLDPENDPEMKVFLEKLPVRQVEDNSDTPEKKEFRKTIMKRMVTLE